ncbi:alpha/beta hydrolase [Paraflavitalea pollutisoli]|uniref:alpha/beta hydrolase n=1 Tax=Paraflavitalea pollutisoli TaxID=3034143 RepID=UPI0023ED2976|nr:alpha/beta hydrolase [Paraflavitalea sp. H1-2-19X]
MARTSIVFLLAVSLSAHSQQPAAADSLRKNYMTAQKSISNQFAAYYYPNRAKIYALPEPAFLATIDSLRAVFEHNLTRYKESSLQADTPFLSTEQRDIDYFFDRMLLDYPYFHDTHAGKKVVLSKATQSRLDRHRQDFNNPVYLNSRDVRGYIEAFLRHQTTLEVKKKTYQRSDNKRLDAYLNLIPVYFTNPTCREYWQHHYITTHLDNWGSKNLAPVIASFKATCTNERYKREVDSLYTESTAARKGHLIMTYKTVDGFNLDLHLFLPDSIDKSKKYPVMVYFSGGSWTQGNPEWDFYNCAAYAKKGWVSVSVEYRVADRYETTPFEAVKDARSAIRWLRTHAGEYNIDTHRIVASGNSAGGHLVLTTVLADDWNEKTDHRQYSASPNIALVNAGAYNLVADEHTDWISRDLKDKSLVKKISPLHLLRPGPPPILIIHGTNDQSVNYAFAKELADSLTKLGNDFEFHTLEGAPHYIWFDRRFSKQVAKLRSDFLRKYGYE